MLVQVRVEHVPRQNIWHNSLQTSQLTTLENAFALLPTSVGLRPPYAASSAKSEPKIKNLPNARGLVSRADRGAGLDAD